MHLQKRSDGAVRFTRLNAWDVHTFRSLPRLADYGADRLSEERLLPRLAPESELTPEMAMDWVEYVVPELRESFAGNLAVVLEDLAGLEEEPGAAADPADQAEGAAEGKEGKEQAFFALTIPAEHVEGWFRAMNQARLVLSARHGIDSEQLPDLAHLMETGALEYWFQYELFVRLQGWLVEVVMEAG